MINGTNIVIIPMWTVNCCMKARRAKVHFLRRFQTGLKSTNRLKDDCYKKSTKGKS